mgnify:CR=1 FL=1
MDNLKILEKLKIPKTGKLRMVLDTTPSTR